MDIGRFRYTDLRPLFRDRTVAGAALATSLTRYRGQGDRKPLVLGIPRGGVPVAAEVARQLDANLDVIVARKLRSPISSELAIGAVTANGGRYLNEELLEQGKTTAHHEEVTREDLDIELIAGTLAAAPGRL